jgi:hypothetical protein
MVREISLPKLIARTLFILAAACGYVVTTCLSAIPSAASCLALSQTYQAAMLQFGFLAVFCVIFGAQSSLGSDLAQPSARRLIDCAALGVVAFVFIGIGGSMMVDLNRSTDWCFSGSPKDTISHAHAAIPLIRDPINGWKAALGGA